MLKTKKFNGSMIAVVVLSVVLAFAASTGFTFAFFASSDSNSVELEMAGPVYVNLADSVSTYGANEFDYNASQLQPGMVITPEVYTNVKGSSTNALLRASVGVALTFETDTTYTIPNGWTWDTDHYEDQETGGNEFATLAEVYAHILGDATVVENFFLNSIDASANLSGWYRDTDNFYYFFGNGDTYSKSMTVIGAEFTDPTYDDTYSLAPTETVADDLDDTNLLASVVTSGVDVNIPFLVNTFVVPTTWGNEVAYATITITVTVQAMQDYVVDNVTTPTLQVLPTLSAAQAQFNAEFA